MHVNLNPSFFSLFLQKQKEEESKKIELVNPIKKHLHCVKLLYTLRNNLKNEKPYNQPLYIKAPYVWLYYIMKLRNLLRISIPDSIEPFLL